MTCALYSTPSWFGTVSKSVGGRYRLVLGELRG